MDSSIFFFIWREREREREREVGKKRDRVYDISGCISGQGRPTDINLTHHYLFY